MKIISRSAWGARYADGAGPAPLPARDVWLHHSAGGQDGAAGVRALEAIGQARFGSGISYTWVIDRQGRIYQGHSVGRQGTHTYAHNDIGRAICLIGNYEVEHPTTAALDAVVWLLGHAHAKGWTSVPRLAGGHRDVRATACPGRHAYAAIPEINRSATGGVGGGGGDDMSWSEQLKAKDPDGTATTTNSAAAWLTKTGWRAERVRNVLLPTLIKDVGVLRELVRELLAGAGELTEEQVEEAARRGAEAGTREAMPDVAELAAAVAAAVDHELDTAAVEQALRAVLGSLDTQEATP